MLLKKYLIALLLILVSLQFSFQLLSQVYIFRIRTITTGLNLKGLNDTLPFVNAIDFLAKDLIMTGFLIPGILYLVYWYFEKRFPSKI